MKSPPSDVERDEDDDDIPTRFFTNVSVAGGVANEVLHGLTNISRCQNVGDPDVNHPNLAIQKRRKIGNCRRR
jgi:hypothetical protein